MIRSILTAAAIFAVSSFGFVNDAEAALIDAPVADNAYISIGDRDWAWAGPCSAVEPSCGAIDLSYQAGQGWRLPTIAEMDAAISAAGGVVAWANQFVFPGANSNNGSADFACASAYFSNRWDHCDFDVALNGIFNSELAVNQYGFNPSFAETFVVRVSAVPLPGALPLLLAAFGATAAVGRRRRNKAA